MKRVFLAALAFACVCSGREYRPSEVEISIHRREVYAHAQDFVKETFNLDVAEESHFNPVRFNSHGVWGNFEARLKELGDDRFEVQGWVHVVGMDKARISWTIHIRLPLPDPEDWRYRRIDEVVDNSPEILGWKFGQYWSIGYEADYDPEFLASLYHR